MDYGWGDFYHSEKWGQLTAVADGTTTLTDVADALATGMATPYEEALAASFWVDAADYLTIRALADAANARNWHPEPGLIDDNGQVPWLTDPDEVAATAARQTAADAALAQAQQIHRAAVDAEDDHRRRLEANDEAEYHEMGAKAALEADVAEFWRTAVDVEYDQRCADYGNDGRPEDDRHISAEDKAAQAAAVAAIAERTELPTGAVWDAVRDVTDRYARDHTDTATLGQPDWDQVADSWATMLAEQQAYRDDGARAAAAAALAEAAQDREITGTYRDMGWTAEQIAQANDGMTVAQAQDALDRLAAYEAAVSPPAAEPGADATTGMTGMTAAQQRVTDAAGNVKTAEYWLERGEVDPGAGLSEEMPPEWTPQTGPRWPVEPRWTSEAGQARLEAKWAADNAAYAVEQVRLAALPAAERRPDHAVESTAGFLDDSAADALTALGDVPVPLTRAAEQALDPGVRAEAIDAAQQRVIDAAGSVEIARAAVMFDSLGALIAAEQAHADAIAELDALLTDDDPAPVAAENGDTVEQPAPTEVEPVAYGSADYVNGGTAGAEWVFDRDGYLVRAQIAERLAELTAAAGKADDGDTRSPAEQLASQLMADAQDRGDPPPAEGWSQWAHAQVAQASTDIANATNMAADDSDYEGRRLYAQLLLEEARSEVEAGIDVGRVTNVDGLLAEMVDAITENSREHQEELAGAGHDGLTDALDQARAQLAAGDVPEVDRAAHEARIEQLEAETTLAYPQEYSAADDPYDHEFHHGGGAELPAVPAEYTEHPDAYRSGPAASSGDVPVLPGSWDGPSSGITAGMSPADVHAAIEEQLGQARAQLQAGHTSPEWVREQAEYVEHLEEWAYVAGEFAADQSTGDKLGEGFTDAPLAAVEDTAAADRVSALFSRTGERMAAEWAAQVPGRDPAMWGREPSSTPDFTGESSAVDPRLLATADTIAEALRGGDLDGAQRLQAALYDDGPPADTASVPGDTATVEDAASRRDGWEGWQDHWDQERDAGESPGKSPVAEAVAAAHAAVEADSQRAAEQLGEQQQPFRAGDRALTDAVEQAPAMEWGA